jgi:hypothetical protein
MPQGLPKKIEISLLLADLALQLGDPPVRRRGLVPFLRQQPRPNLAVARPPGTTQGVDTSDPRAPSNRTDAPA